MSRSSWYRRIAATTDLALTEDACEFFQSEYDAAKREVDINLLRGMRIEELEKRLPGIIGFRYGQLQEIEAILGFLEIRQTALKGTRRRHYLEQYNRTLNPTTVEKYVEADEDVIAMATLINGVALVRNLFLGISREHEFLHYQLQNVSKQLVAGVNDAVL